jgi:hypothetical protein
LLANIRLRLNGASTLSIMTISKTTFRIMTHSIKGLHMTLSIGETQHNNAVPLG